MGAIASQITSLTIVFWTAYLDTDQKKTSKLRVTGLCAGNSPEAGESPTQMAVNAKKVSIWWCCQYCLPGAGLANISIQYSQLDEHAPFVYMHQYVARCIFLIYIMILQLVF